MTKEREPDEADKARGRRLAVLREERGWSQVELAERAGFKVPSGSGRQQVSRLESGHLKFTSSEQQAGYAKALGFSVGAVVEYARGERERLDAPPAADPEPAERVVADVPPRERLAAESLDFDGFMRGRLLAAENGDAPFSVAEGAVAFDVAARLLLRDFPHHDAKFDRRTLKYALEYGLASVRDQDPPEPPPATASVDRPLPKPKPLAEAFAADVKKKPKT